MQRRKALLNEVDRDDAWNLDKLLDPAPAYEDRSDVVNDPNLTLNEKRAILASPLLREARYRASHVAGQPPWPRAKSIVARIVR